jgi:hypothetical protein
MPFTRETAREAGKKGRAKQLSEGAECYKMPHELRVMRHVVQKPESADKTEEQRSYRGWLKKNPSSFMRGYHELLEQVRRKPEPAGVVDTVEDDGLSDKLRAFWESRHVESGNAPSSGAADSKGKRRLSEGAKVTIAEESGQPALSGDATPASNGDAAALSGDAAPNGTAVEPAKPDAEEEPDDSRYSVWYEGYRRRWTSWNDHIDSIAHVLGVKFEAAEQLVRSRQPLVENVSLSDANKQANRLRQREIIVAVKPCSQG